MRLALIILAITFAAEAGRAEVVDRTIAVVGREPLTAGDLDLQMRLEAMFGEGDDRPGTEHGAALERPAALEHLIEQRLIENDMRLAGYVGRSEADLASAYGRLRAERFGDLSFSQACGRYGVSEEAALDFYRRQVDFAGYVELHFRTGLGVSDAELRRAYRLEHPGQEIPENGAVELRARLLEEKTMRLIDARVKQLRAETRIVLLDAIGEASSEPKP